MNKIWDLEKYKKLARQAVAEGVVLLRNEENVLPLHEQEKIVIFGRNQFNYYKSGTGSGGGVNVNYVTDIYSALYDSGRYQINSEVRTEYENWIKEHPFNKGQGWGAEPWYQEEMPLSEKFVIKAFETSEVALILIGRTAGEDQDNQNTPGSFLLTDMEREMLQKVCKVFRKTIVLLNTGNIIDMSWIQEYQPSAVAYVWQGGQEGGNGVLDILSGDVSPSGKLSDTIAGSIEDYPSTVNYGSEKENVQSEDIYVGYRYFETFARNKVLFPFGFGLSYTTFEIKMEKFCTADCIVEVEVLVKNTGDVSGKETVQIYTEAPQGLLGKPSRVLCGFAKTEELKPGESQSLSLRIPFYTFASYDDSGMTGRKSCYVLEAGEYKFYLGSDVRSAFLSRTFTLDEIRIISKCSEALAPVREFKRLKPYLQLKDQNSDYAVSYEFVPQQSKSPRCKRSKHLPETYQYCGDQGYKLVDVADGKVTMETFISQLADKDLCAMMRGEGMSSPKVTPGIAGAFGGITNELLEFGIPVAGCADGPSGIRMDCGMHAFLLPNGTCLACTFNESLTEELFEMEGIELRKNKVDALLGPGMNIHRNPLNGRNFEYFSEDPLLTGKMAAAQLKGMHKYDVTGTIKHFACNTQEFKRNHVNSIVSERAAREIYLKGFEIAVKEGNARSIMTSYGPINGIWCAGNWELLTQILRQEWDYDGIVMTDWWSSANDDINLPASGQNVAAQSRAQNDLNMVVSNAGENSNNDNLMVSLVEGTLSRGELQRNASNICRFLIKSPAFSRMLGKVTELDEELKAACSDADIALRNMYPVAISKEGRNLDISLIDTEKGKNSCFDISIPVRGTYQLAITLRGGEYNSLAQLPITIFKDQNVVMSLTLKGDDTEWRTEKVNLGLVLTNHFYLRFFFAQSGIEIKQASITLIEDYEERIRIYLLQREKETD